MTHYDVLGVEPSASSREIRAVYVELARRHHPDAHGAVGSTAQAAAERRMQQINEAWAVVGDPARRAEYDDQLRGGGAGVVAPSPAREWRPVEPDDESDDLDPRDLVDDVPIGDGSRPPRALAVAPAFLGLLAIASFAAALVVRVPALWALTFIAGLLAVLALLAAPAVALSKSWQTERRHGR